MTEVPEGRCMVCRQAWEPCRKCKGKALSAKQQATMKRNGTQQNKLPRGPAFRFGLPPGEFRHYGNKTKGDDDA